MATLDQVLGQLSLNHRVGGPLHMMPGKCLWTRHWTHNPRELVSNILYHYQTKNLNDVGYVLKLQLSELHFLDGNINVCTISPRLDWSWWERPKHLTLVQSGGLLTHHKHSQHNILSVTAVHIFTTGRQMLSSERLNIYCNFSTTCLIYFTIYIL